MSEYRKIKRSSQSFVTILFDAREFVNLNRLLHEFPSQFEGVMWQGVKRALSAAKPFLKDNIKKKSYLKPSLILKSIRTYQRMVKNRISQKARESMDPLSLQKNLVSGRLLIKTARLLADEYKLSPNKVTVPKKASPDKPPVPWEKHLAKRKKALLEIGPGEEAWDIAKDNELSAAFVIRGKDSGKLRLARRYHKPANDEFPLYLVRGPSVQSFVVNDFDLIRSVKDVVNKRFKEVVNREIDRRLTKMSKST